ncbi:heparinase II/III family protein [Yoonia sp.]|uniref:heparinase II/III family protein n=1 Tax=Yoonia sp. TaxID=2212373 RepID=UPI003F6C8F8A
MHRLHARRAARTDLTTGFVRPPEPRTIGSLPKGQQLLQGDFLFSGLRVQGATLSVWDIAGTHAGVAEEIHGCDWLDDLAAVGTEAARDRAQIWVNQWIERHGDGRGQGWLPEIVGRRLIRWINHGEFLLRGQNRAQRDRVFTSLARQTLFLSRRWAVMPAGLPRFQALAGTIHAGVSLEGQGRHVDPAVQAITRDCETEIDADGAIATRNPEALLELLSLLNWTNEALTQTNRAVPVPISRAIDRVAPTLRALRHADGALARFHGGGRGIAGRLDQALAASGVKDLPGPGLQMGFARLAGGRTTVIVDAAPPPTGAASANAHASTLAFELTSGRRPLIVNCGSGARFGPEWNRASRATPSHATLGLDAVSSSRLAASGRLHKGQEWLRDTPDYVQGELAEGDPRTLELSHNGYQAQHGLTHARILTLSDDGRMLAGEDMLTTLTPVDRGRFDNALARAGDDGIAWSARFHLHPDVQATLTEATDAVQLTLKSGETWVFRHDGTAKLDLSGSVYLENGQLTPTKAQQVVLSGRSMAYATRVRWSLAKAQDTPDIVRDLVQAELTDAVE